MHVVVRYSFFGELDFERVSAYMSIGQFRDLVAQQLNMEVHTVALLSNGRVLRMNSATLEEAVGNNGTANLIDLVSGLPSLQLKPPLIPLSLLPPHPLPAHVP